MAKVLVNTNISKFDNIPMIALRGVVLFPEMTLRFDVSRQKSVAALQHVSEGDQQLIFLAAQENAEVQNPRKEDIFQIGTIGKIKQIVKTTPDSYAVLVEGILRAKITDYVQMKPFFSANVERIVEKAPLRNTTTGEALVRTAQRIFSEYFELNDNTAREILMSALAKTQPGVLSDFIASNSMMPFEEQQAILEEKSHISRLKRVISLLSHQNSVLKLENEIEDKVRVSMDKNQRDYFLKEQLRTISEELGEESEMDEYMDYKTRIKALRVSPEISEKLEKEALKLVKMPLGSQEATIIRNYLDCCLDLPWNISVSKKHTIEQMKAILDKDHYGLQKVKDRILEHLAVELLSPDIKGQVICLVGPPGTGKSSVARSIARAGGRNFATISLGGVRDEADIRGHRKTYVGAMPGRLINALISAKSNNPVILLDEIDKLGNDYRGDPSSALLELLDAEQNNAFVDHFIELPFDLSNVLFITTANYYENIPEPLRDRMEIISLTSYTREEKRNIAKLHLIPKQLKKHGLKKTQLTINDNAVNAIIDNYTREAGVRELEREIAAICRKTALAIASGETAKVGVKSENLDKYLGPAKFKPDMAVDNEVGVATGLAWTAIGGDTLQIEVSVLEGSGKLELTGSLGDVMKESARAAVSYIRSACDKLGVDKEFYKTKDLHIHVPEGAVPKDGPSAGITITTALVSALSGKPVRKNLAMTGEMTLRGRVLPIGGLKEKAMAAYRMGMKTVLIPEENKPDLFEIDKAVKDALEFIPVKHIDEVLVQALVSEN
ncbi:MAG TPA: endopeptidase La [Oscillospiraceae bacterium]|nr:endopeptidase La [Oscillospiraceae bacterium]HPF56534.1 endopeptidase La [Clostridiales bacterium]HPK34183.1 endopeptidase La [Oscillospiraceae bacterium]HPR74914.1 endopeptidase La [Oscillospiraceae bacterium]